MGRRGTGARVFLVAGMKEAPYADEFAGLEEELVVFSLRREASWTLVPVRARLFEVCEARVSWKSTGLKTTEKNLCAQESPAEPQS